MPVSTSSLTKERYSEKSELVIVIDCTMFGSIASKGRRSAVVVESQVTICCIKLLFAKFDYNEV